MEQQLLRDPEIAPTAEVVADGLGAANGAYVKFVEGLKRHDVSLMDWRYYNDGKAWLTKGEYKWTTPRGTNKVKPIFWLSIWEGFFRVTFFFASDVRGELLGLPLSQGAKKVIRDAKPMGKTMRFVPVVFDVKANKQLSDVYVLAEFRKMGAETL